MWARLILRLCRPKDTPYTFHSDLLIYWSQFQDAGGSEVRQDSLQLRLTTAVSTSWQITEKTNSHFLFCFARTLAAIWRETSLMLERGGYSLPSSSSLSVSCSERVWQENNEGQFQWTLLSLRTETHLVRELLLTLALAVRKVSLSCKCFTLKQQCKSETARHCYFLCALNNVSGQWGPAKEGGTQMEKCKAGQSLKSSSSLSSKGESRKRGDRKEERVNEALYITLESAWVEQVGGGCAGVRERLHNI